MKSRNELLTAYLHDALTSQDKAHVEELLRTDPTVRAQLSDLRQTQVWIKQDLQAHINRPVPATMTFDAIAARVEPHKRKPTRDLRTRWVSTFAGLAALCFLSFAFIYSIGDINGGSADSQGAERSVFVITETPIVEEVLIEDESATIPTETPIRPTITPNSSIPERPTITPNSSIPMRPTITPNSSIPTRTVDS